MHSRESGYAEELGSRLLTDPQHSRVPTILFLPARPVRSGSSGDEPDSE